MIIPRRWRDVQTGDRVIDPTGRTFHVLPRTLPFLAEVLSGSTVHTIAVDPNANVPTILDAHSVAVDNLRQAFPSLTPIKET